MTGTYRFGGWTTRRTTVQAHLLLRSRFSGWREQPSAATLWRGTRWLATWRHKQTQTAQNTAQGDAATPLETGLRQRGDAEKQRAAEAKAAREAALASINKERLQKRLRSAQELNECLGSGMDLLSPEQVGQITEAAAAAGSEPRDALRSFGERLTDLRDKNPHASEADLREAVKGAVQAMIARSREQR